MFEKFSKCVKCENKVCALDESLCCRNCMNVVSYFDGNFIGFNFYKVLTNLINNKEEIGEKCSGCQKDILFSDKFDIIRVKKSSVKCYHLNCFSGNESIFDNFKIFRKFVRKSYKIRNKDSEDVFNFLVRKINSFENNYEMYKFIDSVVCENPCERKYEFFLELFCEVWKKFDFNFDSDKNSLCKIISDKYYVSSEYIVDLINKYVVEKNVVAFCAIMMSGRISITSKSKVFNRFFELVFFGKDKIDNLSEDETKIVINLIEKKCLYRSFYDLINKYGINDICLEILSSLTDNNYSWYISNKIVEYFYDRQNLRKFIDNIRYQNLFIKFVDIFNAGIISEEKIKIGNTDRVVERKVISENYYAMIFSSKILTDYVFNETIKNIHLINNNKLGQIAMIHYSDDVISDRIDYKVQNVLIKRKVVLPEDILIRIDISRVYYKFIVNLTMKKKVLFSDSFLGRLKNKYCFYSYAYKGISYDNFSEVGFKNYYEELRARKFNEVIDMMANNYYLGKFVLNKNAERVFREIILENMWKSIDVKDTKQLFVIIKLVPELLVIAPLENYKKIAYQLMNSNWKAETFPEVIAEVIYTSDNTICYSDEYPFGVSNKFRSEIKKIMEEMCVMIDDLNDMEL